MTEGVPSVKRRIKIEINTREHFCVFSPMTISFDVDSTWFKGNGLIHTYCLPELLGTKLRALYQRKKGRDLFDLYVGLKRLGSG